MRGKGRFASRWIYYALVVLAAPIFGPVEGHSSPSSVTIFGSLQSEAGCPSDFQPDCASTHMAQDSIDRVWRVTLNLPTGNYAYHAALNDGLSELYGKNATLSGPAIDLSIASGPANVRFYYDDVTHWITDNRSSTIASVVGSFQSEIGCAGDFAASCLRSWLEDPDGNGIYRFSTGDIPAGTYSALVVHDEDISSLGSPQRDFVVPPDTITCFSYSPETHVLDISFGSCQASTVPVPGPSSLSFVCLSLLSLISMSALRPWQGRAGSWLKRLSRPR